MAMMKQLHGEAYYERASEIEESAREAKMNTEPDVSAAVRKEQPAEGMISQESRKQMIMERVNGIMKNNGLGFAIKTEP